MQKKTLIHENADTNITCDFGDGDIKNLTCPDNVLLLFVSPADLEGVRRRASVQCGASPRVARLRILNTRRQGIQQHATVRPASRWRRGRRRRPQTQGGWCIVGRWKPRRFVSLIESRYSSLIVIRLQTPAKYSSCFVTNKFSDLYPVYLFGEFVHTHVSLMQFNSSDVHCDLLNRNSAVIHNSSHVDSNLLKSTWCCLIGRFGPPLRICRNRSLSVIIWFLAISSWTRSRHLSFVLPWFRFPCTAICNIFLVTFAHVQTISTWRLWSILPSGTCVPLSRCLHSAHDLALSFLLLIVLYRTSTVMFLSSQVGDQLIEINGYSTHNITHTEAIDLIQNGGATVRLKVKRSAKMHPHLGALLTAAPSNRDYSGSLGSGCGHYKTEVVAQW